MAASDPDHVRPEGNDPDAYEPEVTDSDAGEVTELEDTVYEDERDSIVATEAAEGIMPTKPA